MCKKWRITGRNKLIRRVAAGLTAFAILASGLVLSTAAANSDPFARFTDINPQAWYNFEVAGAVKDGLFRGMDETHFDPEGRMTRAQFVVVLARLCGANPSEMPKNTHFTDLADWHRPYVAWAYENGVAQGVGLTEFAPDSPIKREEMCKMLASALENLLGEQLTTAGATVFTDQNKISAWAVEWVQKCTNAGLIYGRDGGIFEPQGLATRAENACVFFRYKNRNTSLLELSGISLDFNIYQDYYLAYPADFTNVRIMRYNGPGTLSVSVEQYAGFQSTGYTLGQPLNLGHGRAKVTLTITQSNGGKRDYLIALTDPESVDYSYARARVNGTVNVRKQPSTTSGILTTLANNTWVYCLRAEGDWYQVDFGRGTVGYIHSDYLRWGYDGTEMPERYREKIEALQKAHPNWQFSFVDVEKDYNTYLDSMVGVAQDEVNGRWTNASRERIEQFMDPLNSLNEDNIFNFVDLSAYTPEVYTDAGISAIWIKENGLSRDVAIDYFNQAAKSLHLSPYFIASRAALESGYGTSQFAKGTVKGYEGYYNFFGIQCIDSNPTLGAAYAKQRNWNSPFRSIVEGANWFKDQYVDRGSITPYFFRYAAFNGKSYMTDIAAATSDAQRIRKAYKETKTLDTAIHFVIPVYSNMPE